MKALILINTLLCFAATTEIFIAIAAFFRYNFRAKYRSISWLRTEDKRAYSRLATIALFCILLIDILSSFYAVLRIKENWKPYFDDPIIYTVPFFYAALYILSYICRRVHAGK